MGKAEQLDYVYQCAKLMVDNGYQVLNNPLSLLQFYTKSCAVNKQANNSTMDKASQLLLNLELPYHKNLVLSVANSWFKCVNKENSGTNIKNLTANDLTKKERQMISDLDQLAIQASQQIAEGYRTIIVILDELRVILGLPVDQQSQYAPEALEALKKITDTDERACLLAEYWLERVAKW
ncbi:hypothetical protein ACI3E1_07320 [Ligilactobacillus sp. LYQ139]|uniref:hypothetical protein n=1 Tax=Ligilactobacillus sp. LYQ139 TaxID=3378800 RepID=UPI003855382F